MSKLKRWDIIGDVDNCNYRTIINTDDVICNYPFYGKPCDCCSSIEEKRCEYEKCPLRI